MLKREQSGEDAGDCKPHRGYRPENRIVPYRFGQKEFHGFNTGIKCTVPEKRFAAKHLPYALAGEKLIMRPVHNPAVMVIKYAEEKQQPHAPVRNIREGDEYFSAGGKHGNHCAKILKRVCHMFQYIKRRMRSNFRPAKAETSETA